MLMLWKDMSLGHRHREENAYGRSCANSLRLLNRCQSVREIGEATLGRYGNRKSETDCPLLRILVMARQRRVEVGQKTVAARWSLSEYSRCQAS
jgi:hypothetical protein